MFTQHNRTINHNQIKLDVEKLELKSAPAGMMHTGMETSDSGSSADDSGLLQNLDLNHLLTDVSALYGNSLANGTQIGLGNFLNGNTIGNNVGNVDVGGVDVGGIDLGNINALDNVFAGNHFVTDPVDLGNIDLTHIANLDSINHVSDLLDSSNI